MNTIVSALSINRKQLSFPTTPHWYCVEIDRDGLTRNNTEYIDEDRYEKIHKWCGDNCFGGWCEIHILEYAFEDVNDKISFILRWC